MSRVISGHPDYAYSYKWDFADDPAPQPEPEIAVSEFDPAAFVDDRPPAVSLWERVRRWFNGRR